MNMIQELDQFSAALFFSTSVVNRSPWGSTNLDRGKQQSTGIHLGCGPLPVAAPPSSSDYKDIYIYIYIIYMPGTQMTLVLIGKDLVLEG